MQAVPDIPVAEITDDIEFVRPLHGVVDLLVDRAHRALYRLRPRLQPAQMAVVDFLQQDLLILRCLEVAARAILCDDGLRGCR